MKKYNAGFQMWLLVVIVAGLGALTWYAIGPGHWFTDKPKEVLSGAPVTRGPLRISVIERGNLKAADSVSILSGIEGQATILYLIPEGTLVKEGDLVCELDATSLVDKRFQQEIAVRNAEAAYEKSKQTYDIQESQNESDIAKAKQQLDFAQLDLDKFKAEQGERTNRLAKAAESIKLQEEEWARAKEKLEWSQKLFDKGFLTNTELEADQLAQSRSQILLDQARRDLDLLKTFQLPRDEAELVSNLAEAGRELDRVKLQAIAKMADYTADRDTNQAKLSLEREKLTKLETQIAKAKLHSPRAGMVVYGQEEGGRYGNSQPMKEGTQVRERQEIISIPNAGGMIAQASLHESVLKQIEIGQNCVIKVEAITTREFHGKVSFVAVLPDQNSWFANPNTRLYRTEVAITDGIADMRPGMSCSIEILVEDIPDTLYAPVQCVFRTGLDNVAFVVHPDSKVEQRKLQLGKYNERWVQILSGAQEGEILAMTPPSDFVPEAAKESAIEPNTPNAAPAATENGGGGPQRGGDGGGRNRDGRGNAAADGARAPGDGNSQRGAGGGDGAQGRTGRGQITEEQRAEFQKRMANMSEEERTKFMEQFRKGRGNSGGGGESAGEKAGDAAKTESTPSGDGKGGGK